MNTKQNSVVLLLLLIQTIAALSYAQTSNELDNFIYLKGGKYPLGEDNVPIELSPFYISPTEVTYGQMLLFVSDNQALAQQAGRENWNPEDYNYAAWGTDLRRAAVNVNWFDALRYANWLSEQQGLGKAYQILDENEQVLSPTDKAYWDDEAWERVVWDSQAKGYRLPTEAEWEYAASGYETLGYKQRYAGCNSDEKLADYAWYDDNSGSKARPVATRKPNALGLYDMSGNVREWCWDFYENSSSFATYANQKNPYNKNQGKPYGRSILVRGGSWSSYNSNCAVSIRYDDFARNGNDNNGFRLFRTP